MSLTLQPGVLLKSPQRTYRIEKVLGQGGFGITYLAETQAVVSSRVEGPFGSEQQTKTVTLKVALKEFFMKDVNGRSGTQVTSSQGNEVFQKYYSKFAAEADNLKGISHPNIIKVLERFSANGTQYYSMEYIDGGTLDDYIARRRGLPESESVALIGKIGRAIQFMHDKRMLHLDLKPKNVMMRPDGTPVVIDFGLSKQYNDKGEPESSTTIGAGTPGFAPIEQTSYHGGRDFPTTLDVYALGATFYKLLTGITPDPADEVLNNGLTTAPLQRKGVSSSLVSLITDAMHPMRKQRIQTVSAFLSRLPGGESEETLTVELADDTEVKPKVSAVPPPSPRHVSSTSNQGTQPSSTDSPAQEKSKPVIWAWVGLAGCLITLADYLFHDFGEKSLGMTGYLTSFVGIAAFITLIRKKSWSGWMALFSGIAMLLTHFWLGGKWYYGTDVESPIKSLVKAMTNTIPTGNFFAIVTFIILMYLSYREIKKQQ